MEKIYEIPSLEIQEFAASADPMSASPDSDVQLNPWDDPALVL